MAADADKHRVKNKKVHELFEMFESSHILPTALNKIILTFLKLNIYVF